MKKHTALLGMLGMLVVSGFGHSVVAQARLQAGGTVSNFGNRTLAPGFTPDPVTVSISSGGTIDVRTLNLGAGCVGFVTQRPDFILRMSGPSPSLAFTYQRSCRGRLNRAGRPA